MFNYRKIEELRGEINMLTKDKEYYKSVIKDRCKDIDELKKSIRRYASVASLSRNHGPFWSTEELLDQESSRLEQEQKYEAERAKIEAIVRDLLKKNAFKEEQK